MRGAIIGDGNGTAGELLPALKAAGLEAVCACGLPQGTRGPRLWPDAAELFSREEKLEFAVVRGRPELRYRAALAALENRLHVICEPPFCSGTTEFETLRAAAADRGLTLAVLQPWERTAAWQALQRALDDGLLGRVLWAQAQVLAEGPAPEGGITAAEGWRAFAALLAAVRLPPRALAARLTPAPEKGARPADAAASAQVHFDGADGAVHLACGAHARRFRVEAVGEKGRADLDGDSLVIDVAGLKAEPVRFKDGLARPDDAVRLAGELSDFAKEARGEVPAGTCLRNARYCVKLMKNSYYSAAVRSAAVPL